MNSVGDYIDFLPNKSGVWLLTAEHRHKTKLGGEVKRSLLKCCTIWGSGQLPGSRFFSSAKHRKKNVLFPKRLSPKTMSRSFTPLLPVLLESKAAKWIALWLQDSSLESTHVGPVLPLPLNNPFPHHGPGAAASHCSCHAGAPSMVPGAQAAPAPGAKHSSLCICAWISEEEKGCGPGLSLERGPRHGTSPWLHVSLPTLHLNPLSQNFMRFGRAQLPSQNVLFSRLDWQVSTSPCCHVLKGSRRAFPSVNHPSHPAESSHWATLQPSLSPEVGKSVIVCHTQLHPCNLQHFLQPLPHSRARSCYLPASDLYDEAIIEITKGRRPVKHRQFLVVILNTTSIIKNEKIVTFYQIIV